MGRSTFPVLLILVVLAALSALALPELFGSMSALQASSTGVSASLSDTVGRFPAVIFLFVGITFLGVLTVGLRR